MNTENKNNAIGQEARALLNELQEKFQIFRDYLPLAIGIDKQLIERMPEVNRKRLRIALSMHTNSLRYLKTLEKAASRYNLDANPTDALTDEHRKHAADVLKERYKKNAERLKAKKEAEAAEQKRTQKLNQLVEKFGKGR